ncbi:hypothetical protein KUCAC02_032340, partial [Chaenocephalus aceratus]
ERAGGPEAIGTSPLSQETITVSGFMDTAGRSRKVPRAHRSSQDGHGPQSVAW